MYHYERLPFHFALDRHKVGYEQQQFSTNQFSCYYSAHLNFSKMLLFAHPQTYRSRHFSLHIHWHSLVAVSNQKPLIKNIFFKTTVHQIQDGNVTMNELKDQYQILPMPPRHLDKTPSQEGQNHLCHNLSDVQASFLWQNCQLDVEWKIQNKVN